MAKIVPHLWYDKEAKEAAQLYVGLFEQSKIIKATVIENTPSGDAEIVSFELSGQRFEAISAGPFFKFNPSISLMVACYSVDEVNTLWKALSKDGTELMPLGEYPFSKWYSWVQDRFGLSWQLMLVDNKQTIQKLTPNFLFSREVCGKAEEAIRYYAEIFENSEVGMISRYNEGEAALPKAKINYGAFKLEGMDFSAMDNGFDGDFTFNEAFSLIINCRDQQEVDYYWDKLSAVPEAEQCGWIKDKFGLSWQIVPQRLNELMESGDREKSQRVTESLLKMKKLDIEILQKAYDGLLF